MSKFAFALCVAVLAACIAPPVAQAGAIKTLHLFTDPLMGAGPNSQLVLVGNHTVFGTTDSGGTENDHGTVFKTDTRSGVTTVLHSFGAPGDGAYPNGVVEGPGGDLYGSTGSGGITGSNGVLFKINKKTGKEVVLFRFPGDDKHGYPDGYYPNSNLVFDRAGTLYGTTNAGDRGSAIFKFDPTTRAITVLHVFDRSLNSEVWGRIALDATSGTLFGMTSNPAGNPTIVYKVDIATGNEATICDINAFGVRGGVTFGPDRQLYVVTDWGGAFRWGEIYRVDPNSGQRTILHTFNYGGDKQNGGWPSAVSFGPSGLLYATTNLGGTSHGDGFGLVFSIDPASGALTIVAPVTNPARNGAYPIAGVTFSNDGWLFSTTRGGRRGNQQLSGSVFKLKP